MTYQALPGGAPQALALLLRSCSYLDLHSDQDWLLTSWFLPLVCLSSQSIHLVSKCSQQCAVPIKMPHSTATTVAAWCGANQKFWLLVA